MKNSLALAIIFSLIIINFLSAQDEFLLEQQNEAGIDHVYLHIELLGGGCAFFDYNNDGHEDLYLTSGQAIDHLYHNNGDGTFTNISVAAGLVQTSQFYTTGVIAGDIDNDGFKDLFVTTRGSQDRDLESNLLFYNNGDGTFTQIWDQDLDTDASWAMGSVFVDFDLDGLLDIYVVSYIEENILITDSDGFVTGFAHECFENRFYHNQGEGKFIERAAELGLENAGCALAVTANDFDFDGDMDIYLANDFGEFIVPNSLFENNSGENFLDVAPQTGADIGLFGMGIAVGDIDGDLDFDYYVTNLGRNVLLEKTNLGFRDITTSAGVENAWVVQDLLRTTGWGTVFFDLDHDSDLDLFVSNGKITAAEFIEVSEPDPNKFYENNGDLTFKDITQETAVFNATIGRGAAVADYDNDGDLDLVQVVMRGTVDGQVGETLLYNNQIGQNENWLQIKLEGTQVNRDAYGSKIYVHADNRVFLTEISGGSSHASHNSSIAHFGLKGISMVDSIEVVWTGGDHSQWVYDIEVNQRIDIKEDELPLASIELLDNDLISIFPNPNSGFFQINFTQLEWPSFNASLYNAQGKLLYSQEILNTKSKVLDFNKKLLTGTYFLKLTNKNKTIIKSLVVVE